ncbi:MAG: YIP1 family protein [Anaerolineales bacterium]|nr:YIP1 family protein [Anaerolineales bacterium]
MFKKLYRMLRQPDEFFEDIRGESVQQPFVFFLQVSAIIALFTPVVNYVGWPSSDHSAAYQAQIMAWQITEKYLLPALGDWAYLIEAFLILGLSLVMVLFMTGFLHLIFRLLGGKGPILNAWKSACYGAGPCALLGWIPYWALFVAVWSLLFQFYYGPKTLYRMKEGMALIILACIVGATLLELMTKGTTVGF